MNLRNYVTPPVHPATMAERIEALKVAKPLLAETNFMKNGGAGPTALIRVAEYITTGHDYKDTHPKGEESTLTGPVLLMPPGFFGEGTNEEDVTEDGDAERKN